MSASSYRLQLEQLAQAMAVPNREAAVETALAKHFTVDQVRMFVDGNLDKRFEKLQQQLEFVAQAFEGFDELVEQYVRENPLAPYDTGSSDGERMLCWLQQSHALTPEQQDYVVCQRARHTIENVARQQRLKYVEFQERFSLVETFLAEWPQNEKLRLFLNPVRSWARFHTRALLDKDTNPPAEVLFFATAGTISTAFFELEGQALINELADFQPCTLGQWASLSRVAPREEIASFCTDLAQLGIISLG